jgi:phosphatidate cytidylyltransferase
MLRTRVLTALVLVPLVLAALFSLNVHAWGALTLVVVAIGASEWARLASFDARPMLLFVGATLASGASLLWLPQAGLLAGVGWPDALVVAICGAATLFWIAVVPVWLYRRAQVRSQALLALAGWLVLVSTWFAVVHLQARSPGLLLALMAIVWIADTAAYFSGRRFGRHKLAPSISPGKTWEGVYGALFAVGAYALALLPLAARGGYAQAIGVGAALAWIALVVIVAALSIFGDLFESMLKRQRGVKDSGNILPGHGGVLDRIDALTAAMPAAALIAHYVIR